MGTADYLKLGSWNVICDRCGVKRKADQVKKEWTGLIVCRDKCWEQRHPQDFVRPVGDNQTVAFTRPESADVFVSVTYTCDTEEVYTIKPMDVVDKMNVYIGKGRSVGTITITNSTVTVRCSWDIY